MRVYSLATALLLASVAQSSSSPTIDYHYFSPADSITGNLQISIEPLLPDEHHDDVSFKIEIHSDSVSVDDLKVDLKVGGGRNNGRVLECRLAPRNVTENTAYYYFALDSSLMGDAELRVRKLGSRRGWWTRLSLSLPAPD